MHSWQAKLFFKWIKQHLCIKKFYGNSENVVKSQIRIALSVYVLVAIVKKRFNLDASLLAVVTDIFVYSVRENAHPANDSRVATPVPPVPISTTN